MGEHCPARCAQSLRSRSDSDLIACRNSAELASGLKNSEEHRVLLGQRALWTTLGDLIPYMFYITK